MPTLFKAKNPKHSYPDMEDNTDVLHMEDKTYKEEIHDVYSVTCMQDDFFFCHVSYW